MDILNLFWIWLSIKNYSNIDLIIGNVATAEELQALIDSGADAVKIGIGSGSSLHNKNDSWSWCSAIIIDFKLL